MQTMHVVSIRLHCGNIIWLPWQRPLTNWKIGTEPSFASKALSYGENIAKIRQVRPEIINEIRLFFGLVVPNIIK